MARWGPRRRSVGQSGRRTRICAPLPSRSALTVTSPRASSSAPKISAKRGAAGVGLLELRLDAAQAVGAGGVHLHADAGGAQRLQRAQRHAACAAASGTTA